MIFDNTTSMDCTYWIEGRREQLFVVCEAGLKNAIPLLRAQNGMVIYSGTEKPWMLVLKNKERIPLYEYFQQPKSVTPGALIKSPYFVDLLKEVEIIEIRSCLGGGSMATFWNCEVRGDGPLLK